jgi:hypothetical protein
MPFDGPAEKAEALDNSRMLDVHRWSSFPQVNKAVDAIFDELAFDPRFRGNTKLRKKHIKVVVLDLYATWLTDPARYVAYHCSPNAYEGNTRYNRLRISSLTIPIVRALHERGFVEYHRGYFDRQQGAGRISRVRATDQLIRLIRDRHSIPPEAIERWKDQECIVLRDRIDGNRVDIDYKDTNATRRMRNKLKKYNHLLDKTSLTVLGMPPKGIPSRSGKHLVYPVSTEKFVRRVFNNGSWKDGGRFYGGWWQRIPSEWRTCISIDGSEGTVETDYSGHHIVLLYAKEGIDYWKSDGNDPYQIDGIERSERMRSLLKQVLLIAINAKNRKTAASALRKEINFHPDEYGWVGTMGIKLEALIDAFSERHRPIAHHLFSNAGVKLQRLDADIAEEVILHFTTQKVPVLCIHDSFVIAPKHEKRLNVKMIEALKNATRRFDKTLDVTPKLKTSRYRGKNVEILDLQAD